MQYGKIKILHISLVQVVRFMLLMFCFHEAIMVTTIYIVQTVVACGTWYQKC
jgi:hypothetical protein